MKLCVLLLELRIKVFAETVVFKHIVVDIAVALPIPEVPAVISAI
jgi:hypothetical protein